MGAEKAEAEAPGEEKEVACLQKMNVSHGDGFQKKKRGAAPSFARSDAGPSGNTVA